MYVPPNSASAGANVAPTPQPVSTLVTLSPVASAARQTELAITGPGATLVPNPSGSNRSSSGAILIQPRPAYIAAQFLAQDLSPQEAQQFFAPSTPPAPAQPSPLSDMRVALGMDQQASLANALKQQATAPAPQVQQTLPLSLPQTAVRRNPVIQSYEAANIRNAVLASTPEVDTTS